MPHLKAGSLAKLQNPLTPVELLDRSVPNCAGPAVSTTLPKNGWETIWMALGGSCSFCCWLDSSIISCMKRTPSSAATALTALGERRERGFLKSQYGENTLIYRVGKWKALGSKAPALQHVLLLFYIEIIVQTHELLHINAQIIVVNKHNRTGCCFFL